MRGRRRYPAGELCLAPAHASVYAWTRGAARAARTRIELAERLLESRGLVAGRELRGGLAVNVHRYVRLTHDVDLVVQLDAENILPAFAALAGLGYRPLVPVTAAQFADPAQRAAWIRDKGMTVLNFHSDRHLTATVDIFVSDPFDFEAEYVRALQTELSPGTVVRFVSIPNLIAMKELANRARDRDDIEHLRMILEEQRER